MANYNNYPEKGPDFKIKTIQNVLSNTLGFTNVDYYGRVLRGLDKNGDVLVPEVMISDKESKEVYYNDQKAKGGNVFFVLEDNHTTNDGILFTAKTKIVFMLHLNNIKAGKTFTDAEAQDVCIKLIQKTKAIKITGIETGLNNVLADFNTKNIKLSDSRPFHVFSINGDLKYQFNCNN